MLPVSKFQLKWTTGSGVMLDINCVRINCCTSPLKHLSLHFIVQNRFVFTTNAWKVGSWPITTPLFYSPARGRKRYIEMELDS